MKNFYLFLKNNATFYNKKNELKTLFISILLVANFVHGQNSYLVDKATTGLGYKTPILVSNDFHSNSISNSFKKSEEKKETSLVSTKKIESNVAPNLENELNYIWLNLIGENDQFCQMALGNRTSATNCVDDYDSTRIDGQFTLNSLICSDINDYVIQSRAMPFNADERVALSIRIANAGYCTLFLDHTIGLFSNPTQAIYLHDVFTNTYSNLRIGSYTFYTTSGVFNQRFEVVYNSTFTTLSSLTNTSIENNLLVYKNLSDIILNSGNATISNVKIFDTSGRLLLEKEGVNGSEIRLNIGTTNQVVLVKVILSEGQVITKKIFN